MRAILRIVGLGITALAACSAARAAEPREVHIQVGSSHAPLIATVHVEDYRAAPLDLLTPAAAGDSRMTRFLKTYYEVFTTGDTKRVASLFEPHMRAGVNDYYPTAQSLSEQVVGLRSARVSAVLHWGEYQVGFVAHERVVEGGGTHRWSASHPARCVSDTCEITAHFENGVLGRIITTAFAEKGGAQVAVPAQGETSLPILPAVVDAAQKAVATDPIVLHLNRSSNQTTLAASTVVATLTANLRATSPKPTLENLAVLYSAGTPRNVDVFQHDNEVTAYAYGAFVTWFENHAPWTVSSVYSLGPDVCVALLKSGKGRVVHLLPLQRAGNGWTIISDPSHLDAWTMLSSISTYQALQKR